MEIFEYLPQLIVSYDGNDEFANLIHVKKADKDKDYFCPCCGGIVKPRAVDSTKEQSHYYHLTGKCTKESQLHFFCKNWLFEKGSQFYIEDGLYQVDHIDVEKSWKTDFGDYRPDITVYTTAGKIIYFEIFFTNRKTGDDYFCKWDFLGNDVVEVNIKDYMFKIDEAMIPKFSYLYHDGNCYSKSYLKRDLYANTIGKLKRNLSRQDIIDYKIRIEKLDYFWQQIIKKSSNEEILKSLSKMCYNDLLSCYDIVKRKQCVSRLKDTVRDLINKQVVVDISNAIGLPQNENIYLALDHVKGRTYRIGIHLDIQTDHITYSETFIDKGTYKNSTYPTIVFSKNIFNPKEIIVPDLAVEELKELYDKTVKFAERIVRYDKELLEFEGSQYKIRANNYHHTILVNNNGQFEVLFDDYDIGKYKITELEKQIQFQLKKIECDNFVANILQDNYYCRLISELQSLEHTNCKIQVFSDDHVPAEIEPYIQFTLYVYNHPLYDKKISPTVDELDTSIQDCQNMIEDIMNKSTNYLSCVGKINMCKNHFWKASFSIDAFGQPQIKVDQNIIPTDRWRYWRSTSEKISFSENEKSILDIYTRVTDAMHRVMKNMERLGYRVMEDRADEE